MLAWLGDLGVDPTTDPVDDVPEPVRSFRFLPETAPPARDIGNGEPLHLVITVDTEIDAGANGTVQFHLASDATAAIDPSTGTKHLSTPVFTVGSGIAAGTVLYAGPVPMEGNAYERFLGILQTTGVAAVTAGKVNAFLTHFVAKWKAYADGI